MEKILKPRTRVSGIKRSIQIMDMLSETGKPASAYEIAKSVGAPLSTVYVIVEELEEIGILTRNADNSIWLGPRLMRYGLAYESKLDLLTEAKHAMMRLAQESGETVQVCFRDDAYMVVVAMAEGEGHFRISSDVGTRVPLNWTASGRLLLGHLSINERVEAFKIFSKPSPTGVAEIDALKLAQKAGEDFNDRLAIQLGASEFAVACIASPVCDKEKQCLATISIVVSENKAKRQLESLSEMVRSSASQIERALGFKT